MAIRRIQYVRPMDCVETCWGTKICTSRATSVGTVQNIMQALRTINDVHICVTRPKAIEPDDLMVVIHVKRSETK